MTRGEVKKAVGKFRNDKSAGHERVVSDLLKNVGEAMKNAKWYKEDKASA